MRYLLDTHVLLWMFDESDNIPKNTQKIIENIDNQCFISIITLYEIAIKKNIGKLNTTNSISTLEKEIDNVGLTLLPITIKHLETMLVCHKSQTTKTPLIDLSFQQLL